MMNLTLDSLIDSLSEQAGLSKTASEETEKKEGKDEKNAGKEIGEAVQALEAAKKDDKDAKKENDGGPGKKGDDDEDTKNEQTKEAAAKGANLAKEVMQKVASLSLDQVKTEDTMNKQAADAGKALAEALLEKLASVGDQNTENGIAGGVPNKTQVDLAAQVAEQDRIIQNQPGTDGRGNGGTINQIFDAIVADAMSQGAAPVDQNPAPGVTKEEGSQLGVQAPNQVQTGAYTVAGDEVEKAAAVSALVEQGFDFDHAVNLVKEAAFEIEQEEETQVKQAAFEAFLEQGFDFDQAVELTKVASMAGAATRVARKAGVAATKATRAAKGAASAVGDAARTLKEDAKMVPGVARQMATSGTAAKTRMQQAKFALRTNSALQAGVGAAGAGAVGAAGYAVGREKKAALDLLISNGVDFDSAIELVNQKSQEIYGY